MIIQNIIRICYRPWAGIVVRAPHLSMKLTFLTIYPMLITIGVQFKYDCIYIYIYISKKLFYTGKSSLYAVLSSFMTYRRVCFMCMFCRSLFVLLSFFFWPLCCLFLFDLRILITPLGSSNSSYDIAKLYYRFDNKVTCCTTTC